MKKARLFPLYFVLFMDNFGFAIVLVLFAPLILNPDHGMIAASTPPETKNLILASLLAIFPMMQFFGAPFFGDIGDQYGRKLALYLTILGGAIGYVLSALGVILHSIPLLFISRMIAGFFAGNGSVCLASLADVSPEKAVRSRRFGFVTVVWGLGWNIGIFVSGVLSNHSIVSWSNPTIPFWLTSFLSLLSYIVVHYFYFDIKPPQKKERISLIGSSKNIIRSLFEKKTRLLYFVFFLWVVGRTGISTQWLTPYAMKLFGESEAQTTAELLLNGGIWMLGGALLNPILTKRFTPSKIAIWLTLITVVMTFATAFNNVFVFNVMFAASGLFAAVSMSNIITLISIASSKEAQGKVMGLTQSAIAIALFVTPLFANVVMTVSIHALYPVAGIFLAFSLAFLIQWIVSNRKLLQKAK